MEDTIQEPEDIVDRLRENADLDAAEHVPADIVQMQRDAIDEILRLRAALRPFAELLPGSLDNVGGGTLVAPTITVQLVKDARGLVKTPNAKLNGPL